MKKDALGLPTAEYVRDMCIGVSLHMFVHMNKRPRMKNIPAHGRMREREYIGLFAYMCTCTCTRDPE